MAESTKAFRHYVVYRLTACAGFIFRRLPVRIALSLGEHLAALAYHLIGRRRKITISNLRLAFGGEKSQRELKQIAMQSYHNLGKSLIELLRFPLLTRENIWDLVTVYGRENFECAIKTTGNAIVFIPHFGNHELLAPVYGALCPRSLALAFPLKNPYLNDMINGYRSRLGLGLITKRQAARHVLKALRTGHPVGFLADQDAGREGVFVEFFGRLASCARGPVAMALKTGAPILFSINIRQPDDKHVVIISPPMELESTGDLDKDVAHNTAKLMAELESYIRQYPGQWMWQHNRWKTRPSAEWQDKRGQRRLDSVRKG
jgi:KDO2-lipid IV(A) lauroyltransferase